MRIPALARVVLVSLASVAGAARLAAQYEEPSAVEFFQKSLGPAYELFGWAVAPLGDVNGDGVLDLAVAAPFARGRFSASSAGRVVALSGASGAVLWSNEETRTSAILGYALETMHWDGDGVLDVVAGAPFATEGRVWIWSGASGALLAELVGPATGSGFGASLATGGDFDGDGTPDLLVAAPFLDTLAGNVSGRVLVFARGALTPWTALDGPYAGAQFGLGLAFAGDTRAPADGRDEIVVGYRDAASFFDGFAALHEWNGTSPALRYTVSGVGMGYDLMGDRVDGGADLDGDGFDDFLVGDMRHSEVELFSGATGARIDTLDGAGELGGFGAARFVRDMDGDSRSDVVVGAWQSNAGAAAGGKVFVYSGATRAILKTITSTTVQLNFGVDVRGCADFNGDGRRDLVIGAYGDGFGGALPGAVRVVSGHVPAPVNFFRAAERATDPLLADTGGDPGSGPLAGSPLEVFDLSLDCSNAPAPGSFAIRVRLTGRATPLATPHGWSWLAGPLLWRALGVHAQDVVRATPAGLVLPADPALVGLSYAAQGLCGGRFSTALVQTIGR